MEDFIDNASDENRFHKSAIIKKRRKATHDDFNEQGFTMSTEINMDRK